MNNKYSNIFQTLVPPALSTIEPRDLLGERTEVPDQAAEVNPQAFAAAAVAAAAVNTVVDLPTSGRRRSQSNGRTPRQQIQVRAKKIMHYTLNAKISSNPRRYVVVYLRKKNANAVQYDRGRPIQLSLFLVFRGEATTT